MPRIGSKTAGYSGTKEVPHIGMSLSWRSAGGRGEATDQAFLPKRGFNAISIDYTFSYINRDNL